MWFEILVSMLGPAGLGALVGGLTGASGAIIAGTITSVSATRRERYARLFTEQKLVYSEYSAVVRHLQSRLIHGDENVGSGPTSDQIRDLEILASKRVRKAHDTTMEALNHMLKERARFIATLTEEEKNADEPLAPDAGFLAGHKQLESALRNLEYVMRKDLGVR